MHALPAPDGSRRIGPIRCDNHHHLETMTAWKEKNMAPFLNQTRSSFCRRDIVSLLFTQWMRYERDLTVSFQGHP